ncbi:deoxynucleoside kinase [Mycoplasma sp. ES3157-GEN-MYC]|uniref:Deoxynucleoside kinase n=1 Tax=Mycoplasma miroungigenitalium TaxID=754515 RepID=A0A6M4JF51_9MOLU|nr:deoxynucleoside kinase [Mycoplasma miroungigenitalium]MBU4690217.1 deoxynucleoside kinase [Mycoplasma miroungigenitalium]MBU4691486.1 deoxynucleoside kinase [Mycoplasma miroungigenitalium]QJR43321.1 deoxynucleoside kinase [Mycoplasma miroungigenitalium]
MVIGISGMIGSGKSTLAKGLNNHYKNSILLEEFEENDPVFNTFLRWFYEQKQNIDIGFQSFIIESLSDSFQKCVNKFNENKLNWKTDHIFLDRFNLEHYIFAVMTLKSKKPKYLKGFDAMFRNLIDPNENPDLAIYIDINFDTFKERITKRGRKSEIDNYEQNEEYFKELHALYKDLFVNLMKSFNIPFAVIDSNGKNDIQILGEAIEIIEKFDFSKSKRYNY